MKRMLSLILVLICAVCFTMPAYATTLAEATEYNLAEKLQKQLWAGSGFQGSLTLQVNANEGQDGQTITTKKPIVFDLSYIYARPTTTETEEHRLDLALMDNEEIKSELHLQLKDQMMSLESALLGDGWYTLGVAATDQGAASETVGDAASTAYDQLLGQTGIPSLAAYAFSTLSSMQGIAADSSDLFSTYLTKVDLWIEGYRQSAVLDKLEDGTSTMLTQYTIPASAIKSQAKQLVLDILSDPEAITKITELLDEEYADLLLDTSLQSYYFSAIDALPLSGNLTISRTVALTGDTIELHMSLPIYDVKAGDVTLAYDRVRGQGDLPDDNTIRITNDERDIMLAYFEYSTMTEVTVWQGTFTSRPLGVESFAVGSEESTDTDLSKQIIDVAFMLKQETAQSKDEENRDVFDYLATLTLAPNEENTFDQEIIEFPLTEVSLNARFVSKELKKAATEMDATLTIGGDEWPQNSVLTLAGKSRSKWELEALPEDKVNLAEMKSSDLDTMLLRASARAAVLLIDYIQIDATQDSTAVGSEATDAPETSEFPTVSPAPKVTETASPTPEVTETDSPAPAATETVPQNG